MANVKAFWVAAATLLLGLPVNVETREPGASSEEIDGLIRQLDDDLFHAREHAHRQLVRFGKPAVAPLRRALNHPSAEVRHRGRMILREMMGPGLALHLSMNAQPSRWRGAAAPNRVADRDGKPEQALAFSGDSCLIVPDRPGLDTDEAFTLAAWIKPTAIKYQRWIGHKDREDQPVYPWGQGDAAWAGHFIACKWDSQGSNGDYIFAITPSGRLALGVSNRSRGFVSDGLYTKKELAIGEWVHVAGVFDGGEIKLYVNGQLEQSKKSARVRYTNRREYVRDDLYVGDFWNHGPNVAVDYSFHGVIDELCLFNRALSASRITHVMNITKSRGNDTCADSTNGPRRSCSSPRRHPC
ncbi:MAG: LamG domain-containing protein [Planctomycetales bacterium]